MPSLKIVKIYNNFTFIIRNPLLSHFYFSLATNNPIGLRVQFFLPKLPGCVTALPSSIQTRILLLQHQVIAWSTNNSLLHLGSTLILTESRVLMKPFWKTHKYKIFYQVFFNIVKLSCNYEYLIFYFLIKFLFSIEYRLSTLKTHEE